MYVYEYKFDDGSEIGCPVRIHLSNAGTLLKAEVDISGGHRLDWHEVDDLSSIVSHLAMRLIESGDVAGLANEIHEARKDASEALDRISNLATRLELQR